MMKVLKSKNEIAVARREMRSRGIDCADHGLRRLLMRCHFLPGIKLGDSLKSWDVLNTVNFLYERITLDAPVLDLGAYASEILPVLHRLGITNLTGIDLNPTLADMPYRDKIHYVVDNFYATSFGDASFYALTAISVIEHGFQMEKLLSEISRLLRPGGYFIASIDYWPEKIDTRGITAFGMDWTIFSRDDLTAFFDRAREFELELVGVPDFETGQPTVTWLGRSYTFAWMALRKKGKLT
jgi:SAM-dependent methyltransferase